MSATKYAIATYRHVPARSGLHEVHRRYELIWNDTKSVYEAVLHTSAARGRSLARVTFYCEHGHAHSVVDAPTHCGCPTITVSLRADLFE